MAEKVSTVRFIYQRRVCDHRDIPSQLRHLRDAPVYYGVASERLNRQLPDETLAELAAQIERLFKANKIRDRVDNPDVLNTMRNVIEDYLYQVEVEHNIRFTAPEMDEIIEQMIDIARKRA